jgi:hypothetical protein
LDKEENKHFLSEALKNGKVFIDGWTATINTTLQNYKEAVEIVFLGGMRLYRYVRY